MTSSGELYTASHQASYQASCPSCEFERGEAGQPQLCADGTMNCKSCNSIWRELGEDIGLPTGSHAKSHRHPSRLKTSPQNYSGQSYFGDPPAISFPSNSAKISSGRLQFLSLLLFSAAMAIGAFLVVLAPDGFSTNGIGPEITKAAIVTDRLILDNIKFEAVQNSDTAIWIISARISNPTANTLKVPAIVMRLGVKGSSGYITRTYQPALQMLAPGANLKIRTSLHKPAPGAIGINLNNGPDLANGIVLEFVGINSNSG